MPVDWSCSKFFESTIYWTCSLFTWPYFLSFLFKTFMYLTISFFPIDLSSSRTIVKPAISGAWSLFTCSYFFLFHNYIWYHCFLSWKYRSCSYNHEICAHIYGICNIQCYVGHICISFLDIYFVNHVICNLCQKFSTIKTMTIN